MGTVILTGNYVGGKQTLVITAGTYTIECWGAEGQSSNGNAGTSGPGAGGKGAYATATLNLPACTLIYAVGQMPVQLGAHSSDGACGGGGGMTAVAIQGVDASSDIPLVVAAGGGGGTETMRGGNLGQDGQGFGGTQGNSGGGWSTRGSSYAGNSWVSGLAAVTGATYGGYTSNGGYGGGGGGQDDSGGGGGGGYYGGNYGKGLNGGYSYVTSGYSPINVIATPGNRYGNGLIIITRQDIQLKANLDGTLMSYSDGWVKIDGVLRQIDGIWVNVNGVLKKL